MDNGDLKELRRLGGKKKRGIAERKMGLFSSDIKRMESIRVLSSVRKPSQGCRPRTV